MHITKLSIYLCLVGCLVHLTSCSSSVSAGAAAGVQYDNTRYKGPLKYNGTTMGHHQFSRSTASGSNYNFKVPERELVISGSVQAAHSREQSIGKGLWDTGLPVQIKGPPYIAVPTAATNYIIRLQNTVGSMGKRSDLYRAAPPRRKPHVAEQFKNAHGGYEHYPLSGDLELIYYVQYRALDHGKSMGDEISSGSRISQSSEDNVSRFRIIHRSETPCWKCNKGHQKKVTW